MYFSDPLLDQASKGKKKRKTSEEIVVRSEQTIKRNALVDYYGERGKTDIVGQPRKNGLICRKTIIVWLETANEYIRVYKVYVLQRRNFSRRDTSSKRERCHVSHILVRHVDEVLFF